MSSSNDKDCEPGEHLMNNGEYSIPTLDLRVDGQRTNYIA